MLLSSPPEFDEIETQVVDVLKDLGLIDCSCAGIVLQQQQCAAPIVFGVDSLFGVVEEWLLDGLEELLLEVLDQISELHLRVLAFLFSPIR